MQGKNIKYYKEIYDTRDDYKRDLQPLFNSLAPFLNFKIKTVLDYGCGRGNLTKIFEEQLSVDTYKYDPAIPEYDKIDVESVDLVTNSDVLEHIPRDEIDSILRKIASLSSKAFFSIHLGEAGEILSSGENAHCTIETSDWWKKKLYEHFPIVNQIPSYYPYCASFVTWKISFREKLIGSFLFTFFKYKKKFRNLKNIAFS